MCCLKLNVKVADVVFRFLFIVARKKSSKIWGIIGRKIRTGTPAVIGIEGRMKLQRPQFFLCVKFK